MAENLLGSVEKRNHDLAESDITPEFVSDQLRFADVKYAHEIYRSFRDADLGEETKQKISEIDDEFETKIGYKLSEFVNYFPTELVDAQILEKYKEIQSLDAVTYALMPMGETLRHTTDKSTLLTIPGLSFGSLDLLNNVEVRNFQIIDEGHFLVNEVYGEINLWGHISGFAWAVEKKVSKSPIAIKAHLLPNGNIFKMCEGLIENTFMALAKADGSVNQIYHYEPRTADKKTSVDVRDFYAIKGNKALVLCEDNTVRIINGSDKADEKIIEGLDCSEFANLLPLSDGRILKDSLSNIEIYTLDDNQAKLVETISFPIGERIFDMQYLGNNRILVVNTSNDNKSRISLVEKSISNWTIKTLIIAPSDCRFLNCQMREDGEINARDDHSKLRRYSNE